jgi:hypothetical protein
MYLILVFLYILNCYSIRVFKNKYLNCESWDIIKNCIINPKTDNSIRNKINNIIYYYYDDWTYYKAINFKKFHYNKCKNIPLVELYSYSNMGLLKAIKNYNGKSNFTKYAEIYVNGELYKGLTELYPISIVPKKERIKKQNISDVKLLNNKKRLKTKLVGNDNWLYQKNNYQNNYYVYKNYWEQNYDFYENFWEKINKLEPFAKYLIYAKYDYLLESKVSNLYLAKKFGYSEEHIRKTIKNALHFLH